MDKRIAISAILIAGLLAVGLGRYISTQQTEDTTGDNSAVGSAIVKVAVPEFSAAESLGGQFYTAKCAACHGENGAGRNGIGPPLVHKIYEPNHHGDMAFLLAARNGVPSHHWPFGNMPPVQGVTDGEVKQIVSYIRALQRANDIN